MTHPLMVFDYRLFYLRINNQLLSQIMYKILFTPIILLLFQSYLRAQNFCLTPPNSESSLNMMLNKRNQLNESYILRIYFHVIRRTNGTGGQSLSDVREAFDILNNDFNSHNIFFCWNNEIDFIDNDDFFDSPNTDIFNINNHDDGIDVYLFDDSLSGNGRANGVGVSTEFWVSGSYWKEPFNALEIKKIKTLHMKPLIYLLHPLVRVCLSSDRSLTHTLFNGYLGTIFDINTLKPKSYYYEVIVFTNPPKFSL